jgi:hypothetical protein
MPQRFLFDSDELAGDFETTVNEQRPSRQCQLAARSDAHLATDASRDLVVSGISACLSLLHLKLSCLKFPEDRSSTSELSENLDFKVSGPRGAATLERFTPRSSQTTSLFDENARACAELPIAKIQFNGIGGSQTYISLTPNSVVSALRFLWRGGL